MNLMEKNTNFNTNALCIILETVSLVIILLVLITLRT